MRDTNYNFNNRNKSMFERLKRNIALDYLYSFICNLNMSSSIWVLYLMYRGMNLFQVGILEGIFHITGMITEVPSGMIADMFGRKKSMMIGRLFLTLSCIVMLFATNFAGFAIGFILHAWSYNFNSGSEEALVYDSLKIIGMEESYPKINGKINFLIEVSQGIAMVVGGVLAEISYSWCYFTCIVLAVLCFLPLIFMSEPAVKKEHVKYKRIMVMMADHFDSSWKIVKEDKRILIIVVYYAVIFTEFTVLLFYSQQFFQNHGLNKIQISAILFFASLSACAGALSCDILYKRMKQKLPIIGAFGIAFCMSVYGLNHLCLAIVALMIASFFNAVLYPVQSSILNAMIPSEQRATLISLNSMMFSIVMVFVFPLVGGLAEILGLPIVFAGLGVFMGIGNSIVQMHGRKKG